MEKKILGVLGGLGPMASVYFYEMLTSHTNAIKDQQHLNILISSRADIPDRTDFILKRSEEDPLPKMVIEVERLISAGAGIIAIPCNTAHYFYQGISEKASVPVLNIISEASDFCRFLGLTRVGVLATEGTVSSGAYKSAFAPLGLEYLTCSEEDQKVISSVIFDQIKQGKEPDLDAFLSVCDHLTAAGCERIILGCTELSLLKRNFRLGSRFIDSLEILAAISITSCGGETIGFDPELTKYSQEKGRKNICC